jgi:seryl-tRNA synthetase
MSPRCWWTGFSSCRLSGSDVSSLFFRGSVADCPTLAQHTLEQAKARVNQLKKEIGPHMKAQAAAQKEGKPFDATAANVLISEKDRLEIRIAKNEVVVERMSALLQEQVGKLGNIVDKTVPVSNDEAHNRVEKTWGDCVGVDKAPLHHSDVMWRLSAYEDAAGVKIAGQRGFFLTGPGVLVNMALMQYGLDFLRKRGYTPTATPLFMNQSVMAKTAQLSDFDEQLYKVTGHGEDKYLIATSEQPLSAMYISGNANPAWIDKALLPIRLAGVSTCFRKEAGKSGADLRGIFRVHQFEKIEQFTIVPPDDSEEEHKKMLALSEEFTQSLGLSYRVVNIVSGALNDAAAKKFDLEAWFPNTQEFRELVSCSNCTDFQSRKLNIRYGFNEGANAEKKAPFVHMLNSTLCATERTMCCLMENYQTAEGFTVPEVLRPYCSNIAFFPFTREAKKEEKEAKAAAPAKKK